ncbi:MAG: zf-HC2 domain-containing protein [Armatimonadetes bacterium]|nr:zf-HC2 domain-containing protein [Armatimonadota bacterium]
MTCDKAQELFSELHEESISEGLRQAVERHIAECPSCEHTFGVFGSTYRAIADLPAMEVPSDIREHIARRLDHVDWERKQTAPAGKGFRFVLLGVAAALLVGAIVFRGPWSNSGSNGVGANITGAPGTLFKPLETQLVEGSLHIQMVPKEDIRIQVLQGGSDFETLPPRDAKRTRVDIAKASELYDAPLNVIGGTPPALWLKADNETSTTAIFFPQPAVKLANVSEGNLVQTLQALATRHNVTIEARLEDAGPLTERRIDGASLMGNLDDALAGTGLTAKMVSDSLVRIR